MSQLYKGYEIPEDETTGPYGYREGRPKDLYRFYLTCNGQLVPANMFGAREDRLEDIQASVRNYNFRHWQVVKKCLDQGYDPIRI